VSDDRLVIGVPFYGYGPGGEAYSYGEIVERNPEYASLNYAEGIHYNGMNTIREKAEYSKAFGGTMIWEVSHDSFGNYSLLNVIKGVLNAESGDISGGELGEDAKLYSFMERMYTVALGRAAEEKGLNYYLQGC